MTKYQHNVCSKIWREIIIKKAKGLCEVCGKPANNCHHIISRSNHTIRYYVPNGILLDAGCHVFNNKSAHKDILWFHDKLKQLRGEEFLKDLRKESLKIKKLDFEKTKAYLENNLKKL